MLNHVKSPCVMVKKKLRHWSCPGHVGHRWTDGPGTWRWGERLQCRGERGGSGEEMALGGAFADAGHFGWLWRHGMAGWWFSWNMTGLIFQKYIGNNHPTWRTHIFQRGWNHQPDGEKADWEWWKNCGSRNWVEWDLMFGSRRSSHVSSKTMAIRSKVYPIFVNVNRRIGVNYRNDTLNILGETHRDPKEIEMKTPDKNPLHEPYINPKETIN